MFGFQPQDLLIIAIVALILFGPSQLPKIARALGETLREFRKATEEADKPAASSAGEPAPAPVISPKLPVVLPKPPWRIFLSSVVAGMEKERAMAKNAVEALPDLAQAWTWEEGSYASSKLPEQEYLPEVEKCHIFLLILKNDITEPVRKEYETAQKENKPCLVFVKKCARTPAAQEFVNLIGKQLTYAQFGPLGELEKQIHKAVGKLFLFTKIALQ